MVRENVGLTITYNRMKDPDDQTQGVVRLRELSEAMDRAVLGAYGWTDPRRLRSATSRSRTRSSTASSR